jgi:hypothetical protein
VIQIVKYSALSVLRGDSLSIKQGGRIWVVLVARINIWEQAGELSSFYYNLSI